MFCVEELSVSRQSGPSRPGRCAPGGSGPPLPQSAAGSKGSPVEGNRREVSRNLALFSDMLKHSSEFVPYFFSHYSCSKVISRKTFCVYYLQNS